MDILMEVIIEEIVLYSLVFILCFIVVYFYLRHQKKTSIITQKKVALAKEEGMFEPVSLYPYIDLSTCIGSAACITACPEKDILGISDGKATVIKASNCVGHGACFHACPVEAISLRIGTEKRGVELPHVNQDFETNVAGIYIAGELGGMGLIKNSIEQGTQAIDNIAKNKKAKEDGVYDVIIVGAGPAGIAATLNSKKHGLTSLTLEQDSLGGTVYTFPRKKLVMTAPMDLPLYGKVKLYDTSKAELLTLWEKVIKEHNLVINEHTKVESILPQTDGKFKVTTDKNEVYCGHNVLIAIGRRGTPKKLNVPGESLQKVAYRLIESDRIQDEKIVVVGGGDSAVECALLLKDNNKVLLSYRKDKFSRIKPKNREKVEAAIEDGSLEVAFNTNVLAINEENVMLNYSETGETLKIENDLVYIYAGGELPTSFLQKAGIEITKRFGHIMKKY
jgi:thioredoxin reductase/Pyruvate/2-oxoacid:ferredoxin oxidoreductase delta subunit